MRYGQWGDERLGKRRGCGRKTGDVIRNGKDQENFFLIQHNYKKKSKTGRKGRDLEEPKKKSKTQEI